MINFELIGFQDVQDAIQQELEGLRSNRMVTVGIHEDVGSEQRGELTQAELGALLNFGNENIPARPWLEPGVDAGAMDLLDTIADGIEDGQHPDQVLDAVGVVAAGAVKVYMTELRTPPNAPSTILQKGSDNPLIDTGALRASVNYEVVPAAGVQEGLE